MILKKSIGFREIEELGIEDILSVNIVKEAVLSKDENALRELIFNVVDKLDDSNIALESYYYGKFDEGTTNRFDMFTCDCIKEIFVAFGYEYKEEIFEAGIESWEQTEDGYLAGKLYFGKEDITFTADIIHYMHKSLISTFVDTKKIELIN